VGVAMSGIRVIRGKDIYQHGNRKANGKNNFFFVSALLYDTRIITSYSTSIQGRGGDSDFETQQACEHKFEPYFDALWQSIFYIFGSTTRNFKTIKTSKQF
jgi:hypothetical protein